MLQYTTRHMGHTGRWWRRRRLARRSVVVDTTSMGALVQANDPPAVFIDWTQRARALSRDFQVPVERGRDILGTIQQWRPAPPAAQARR